MLQPNNHLDNLKYVIKISNSDCQMDLENEVKCVEHYFKKYNIEHCSYPIYWGEFTNLTSNGVIYHYLGFYNLEKIKTINYNINWNNNISIIKQLINQLINLTGVIHGDLKPSNIVINETNMTASIIDFGLIKKKTTKKNIISTNYITSPESLFSLKKYINCVKDDYINFTKHDYFGLYVIVLELFLNKRYWDIFSSYLVNYLKINSKFIVKHDAIDVFAYVNYKFFYEDTYPSQSYKNLINKIEDKYSKINNRIYLNFDDFFMKYIKPNLNYKIFKSEYLECFKNFLMDIIHFDPNIRLNLEELLNHQFLN